MDTFKTPVIFRKWKDGDIIALFPTCPADTTGVFCDSYEHIGQHGAASPAIVRDTASASPQEYRELQQELKRMGYQLTVRSRFSFKDAKTRQKEIKRIQEGA